MCECTCGTCQGMHPCTRPYSNVSTRTSVFVNICSISMGLGCKSTANCTTLSLILERNHVSHTRHQVSLLSVPHSLFLSLSLSLSVSLSLSLFSLPPLSFSFLVYRAHRQLKETQQELFSSSLLDVAVFNDPAVTSNQAWATALSDRYVLLGQHKPSPAVWNRNCQHA